MAENRPKKGEFVWCVFLEVYCEETIPWILDIDSL